MLFATPRVFIALRLKNVLISLIRGSLFLVSFTTLLFRNLLTILPVRVMITSICEITARIEAKSAPSRVHEVIVACPIFDDKHIRVYRDNYWQLVPFVDGIKDKVTVLLRGWLPTCNISVSTRELEYPSTITCGDSHKEIVCDIISTLINRLV